MILRGYQSDMMSAVGQALRRTRRVVLQSPTGSGKTAVMSAIAHKFIEAGHRVIVLVPRRELAFQVQGTLERFGRYAGLIMAGEERLAGMDAYVCSFDTLHARCVQRDRMSLPSASVVLVDEAHLSLSDTRRDILAAYPEAYIVGFTATPGRTDGRGLGELYGELVPGPSVRWLTDNGYLVPMRYYAGEKPDLSGVKVQAGDYHQGQLEEAVDKSRLIGDILSNWLRLAGGRQTVVFCTSVKHSRHVCEMFNAAGVPTEHVDGNTPTAERDAILERVRTGQTRVVTNIFVCSYGLDLPELSCAVMARPTKSKILWYQSVGRILRPAPGKGDAILLDHAGAVAEHGFIDEPFEWSLEGNQAKENEKRKRERREPKDIECPACHTIYKATHICPECGHKLAGGAEAVPYWEVDLEEVKRGKAKANREMSTEEKRAFYAELMGYANSKLYQRGWASHKYRERFGVWPNAHRDVTPTIPTEATLNYVKHLEIKRRHERKNA